MAEAEAAEHKLFLVDGNLLAYRAFFAADLSVIQRLNLPTVIAVKQSPRGWRLPTASKP